MDVSITMVLIAMVKRCRLLQAYGQTENNILEPALLEQIIKYTTNECIPHFANVDEVNSSLSQSVFRQHYRMLPETYRKLIEYLAPHWQPTSEGGKEPLSLEKTVLIAIATLATPDSYRSIGRCFALTKSTVYWCFQKTLVLVNTYLTPRFIKWPNQEEKAQISNTIFQLKGFPLVVGMVDGCHIPIKRPSENGQDFYNRKKNYSVVLQGICKTNLSFIDVDCRWPGSVHDARVFRTSPIYEHLPELCAPNYFILGDAAYPSESYLLTPYRNNGHLTDQELYFNSQLSKTRVLIENAFALLKGRFRRLKYLERAYLQDTVNSVICGATLHNICLEDPEDIDNYLMEGRADLVLLHDNVDVQEVDRNEGNARRNAVSAFLWHNRN